MSAQMQPNALATAAARVGTHVATTQAQVRHADMHGRTGGADPG